jgi:Carboxypeptidase regulatory-like domain/TonB-dependent Receptor Plug Domain
MGETPDVGFVLGAVREMGSDPNPMRARYMRVVSTVGLTTTLFVLAPLRPSGQGDAGLGRLTGSVVDASTGVGLADIPVVDESSGGSATTDRAGRFSLALPSGPRRLHVSVIGYVLVRRDVRVEPGATTDVTIPLTRGTGTYTETVTVVADGFHSVDAATPAQQVLDSADIQNLRGVLADDPLRAVQALGGVAASDDLRSEFSVRGSNFAHLNFTVDGFATPFLLHTIRAVEDGTSSGSIAMINSDVLEGVTLLNGGYAQRNGNRTGASLDFRLRDGSRDRRQVRAAVSGTAASFVAEGPLGRSRRGSWLVSGRQSYLDLLIDRLTDDPLQFGFSDVQARLVYDISPRQRVDFTVIAGHSRLREPEAETDEDDLFVARNATGIGIAGWRLTMPRGTLSARVLSATNDFRNDGLNDITFDKGSDGQLAGRIDFAYQLVSRLRFEGGVIADQAHESRWRQRPISSTAFRVVNDYAGTAVRSGAYGLATLTITPTFAIVPGVRVDRWSLTDATTASPWIQSAWNLPGELTMRAGAGVYQQFPDFEQVLGSWGSPDAAPERATQIDVGVERMLRRSVRLQLTVFDREDRDCARRADAETHLSGTRLVRGTSAARYANRLDGFARGLEVLIQRRNATGLTGWLSYSYGRNRYHDTLTGETFWGDFDERHAFNLYAQYRLSSRSSVAGTLRAGSNFPAPGYFSETGGRYFVGNRRNEVRLPNYARLDLRANRTFAWSQRRLTLFAEVMNVFNRANVRYSPPSIDGRTREVSRLFEPLIPIVPSAGILVEF